MASFLLVYETGREKNHLKFATKTELVLHLLDLYETDLQRRWARDTPPGSSVPLTVEYDVVGLLNFVDTTFTEVFLFRFEDPNKIQGQSGSATTLLDSQWLKNSLLEYINLSVQR